MTQITYPEIRSRPDAAPMTSLVECGQLAGARHMNLWCAPVLSRPVTGAES